MENERFLSLPQVSDLVGLPPRSVKKLVGEGDFPKAIPITSRTHVWRELEVREWMAERVAEAPERRAALSQSLGEVRSHKQ